MQSCRYQNHYTVYIYKCKLKRMANKAAGKQALTYLLGVCVPSCKQNAAKVRVRRLQLDEHLLMYFSKHEFLYAADPNKLCKSGDTVLIQTLPQKLTRLISHKVVEVIYPLGNITDPITGKKVVASRYRENIEEDAILYGDLESRFKYDSTMKRGRLENTRDITVKEVYVKHTDDPENTDPYAVNPL